MIFVLVGIVSENRVVVVSVVVIVASLALCRTHCGAC